MLGRAEWKRLLLLLLVAIAARAITLGNPVLPVDEQFYYVTGTALWHGQLPFVDIWDRKPVGLFLLYALPAGLGFPAGVWAAQALALAAAVTGAAMVARLADRLGFGRGALAAGSAYILWLDLLGGQGGQTPVFYNPLMLGAALLVLGGGRRRGITAMALVGLALQLKYSMVIEGLFFGCWLLAAEWRATRRIGPLAAYAAALAIVALLPTMLAATAYAAIGQWPAFRFANFQSVFGRNPDPLVELAGNLARIVLIASPPVALAIMALRRADRTVTHRFAAVWLTAAIAGVLAFRPWFDHYALPVLPPACAAAAGCLAQQEWRRRWTPALLLTAALAGQVVLTLIRSEQGDGTQLDRLARAVGRGPGCLYVYSGDVMLHAATGRCAPTRYLFPSHLTRTREFGAVGIDQNAEIAHVLAHRPAVIVMRPPYRGERPAAREIAMATIASQYRLAATLPMGRAPIAVYRPR